jgi:membrane-bound metal-dependent hydrolase YbcI (DUF457 family)
MMAATHGPSGALGGLAGVHLAQLAVPVNAVMAGVWIVGCTAGAMLPDADHPSSTTARLWGPLTSVPCRLLGRLAGGHRAGTHDVSRGAPLLFAAVAALGLLIPQARLVTVALLVGLALAGIRPLVPGRPGRFVVAANPVVSVAASVTPPGGWPAVTIAVAAAGIATGVVIGIAGDACTISGVPWRGRDRHLLPRCLRIRTDAVAERVLVRPLVFAGVVALAYLLIPA